MDTARFTLVIELLMVASRLEAWVAVVKLAPEVTKRLPPPSARFCA